MVKEYSRATMAAAMAKIGKALANIISKAVDHDNQTRAAFTRRFIAEAIKEFPDYNAVIVHPLHRIGGPWTHQHFEVPMSVGTCGYDAYYALKGTPVSFVLDGDGSYINWAYTDGEFKRDGHTLTVGDNPPQAVPPPHVSPEPSPPYRGGPGRDPK